MTLDPDLARAGNLGVMVLDAAVRRGALSLWHRLR